MNGYVTCQRLSRTICLPISFPQTELKAGDAIFIASFVVKGGQRLELRALTLNLIRVLTNGITPIFTSPTYQMCSVGIYRGLSDCSPLAYASAEGVGAAAINPFRKTVVQTPGQYCVLIQNNTSNLDLSVAATGAAKLYY